MRWLEPSASDLRILDGLVPGRITLVSRAAADPVAQRLSRALNADGQTLGVRVSSSKDEARVAKLLGGPVVTAAINVDGRPAESVEEATNYLRNRMRRLNIRQRIMEVRDRARAKNSDLSTVVRNRKDGRFSVLEVIRSGAVADKLVRRVASTPWTPREIEDVT
ncbi:hypothetical protein MMAN_53160 [Mycobacterium mantenii]|nr:hypothetical protein MMAN_53160 [Mycobacterium mantenii]